MPDVRGSSGCGVKPQGKNWSKDTANTEIYTKATCPFCVRAKALLNSKGVTFHELPIDGDAAKREEMIQRSGRTTVPQIFIDAQHIGGCDDLYALDSRGGLDPLLR